VVELDEFFDDLGEPTGDELLVRRRISVCVVGILVGEVLDEQQIVGTLRIPVNAERQRSRFTSRTDRGELFDDRLGAACLQAFSGMGTP
jgi:hypothetical protein